METKSSPHAPTQTPNSEHRTLNSPAIILVRPQLGENIGAAARAMSNFGLTEMRIDSPRDGWPNQKAIEMAAGGLPVIQQAQIFTSLPQALADVHKAYATTGRGRGINKPVLEPEAAMREMRAEMAAGRKVAILFGPERAGLENEDVALADALITIPTDTANPSLNLAQSVVVLGYEWLRSAASGQEIGAGRGRRTPPEACATSATKEELQGFFDHLEQALDAANHFRTEERKPVMWQNLQAIFARIPLSSQEVRTLRGMLRSLGRMHTGG